MAQGDKLYSLLNPNSTEVQVRKIKRKVDRVVRAGTGFKNSQQNGEGYDAGYEGGGLGGSYQVPSPNPDDFTIALVLDFSGDGITKTSFSVALQEYIYKQPGFMGLNYRVTNRASGDVRTGVVNAPEPGTDTYLTDFTIRNVDLPNYTSADQLDFQFQVRNSLHGPGRWTTVAGTLNNSKDTTPPANPSGVSVESGKFNQVLVAWTQPTEEDYDFTEIVLNYNTVLTSTSKVVGTSRKPGFTFAIDPLYELAPYSFKIRHFDKSGNASAYCVSVSFSLRTLITADISDAAITTEKLNDLAVTTAKLNTKAVTTAKIDDLAVGTTQLAALAVTTAKLDDSAVTDAKLGIITDPTKFALGLGHSSGDEPFIFTDDSSNPVGDIDYGNIALPQYLRLIAYGGNTSVQGTVKGLFVGTVSGGYGLLMNYQLGSMFQGSVGLEIQTISTNATINTDGNIVRIDASGGNRTVTLPANSDTWGNFYIISRVDTTTANTVTVSPNTGQTIEGTSTGLPMRVGTTILFWHDSNNDAWRIISTDVTWNGAAWIRTTKGSSFPSSPATGDRHYRSDLRYWCFYDGTRWLTEEEFQIAGWLYYPGATAANEISATQEFAVTGLRSDYATYLTRWELFGYVNGTNSIGSNWSIALRTFTGLTTAATHSTVAWSATTWTRNAAITSFTQPSTSDFGLEINVTKNGTPGPLRFYTALFGRLVIT